MSCPLILVAAYGRKYKDEDAMVADYFDGKDFRISGGPYCSCRDFVGKPVILAIAPGLYTEVTYYAD